MPQEREPNREILNRGQLYFLSHPGAEIFSGYGLTTHAGRMDRLVGLLMVDRPHPADPAWLAQIERRYGECPLTPMTQSGERGLVTQMHIEPESLPFLQSGSHPSADPIAKALEPLLDAPPAPVLKLNWDERSRAWQSEFWIELPPALQEVFRRHGYGCLAVSDGERVSFVTHASDRDIRGFRAAPVSWRWELHEMPTAPLIRFRASILDKAQSPYRLEHFLNVEAPDQAACLSLLVRQAQLSLDLFGDEFEYAFSKSLPQPKRRQVELEAMGRRAIEYYGEVPAHRRDFDRAKAEFQRWSSV